MAGRYQSLCPPSVLLSHKSAGSAEAPKAETMRAVLQAPSVAPLQLEAPAV